MDHLEQAIGFQERSYGDVFDENYKRDLEMQSVMCALIAIAEQLKDLNARLDTISTDLQNVDYTLSESIKTAINNAAEPLQSIAIRHGGR